MFRLCLTVVEHNKFWTVLSFGWDTYWRKDEYVDSLESLESCPYRVGIFRLPNLFTWSHNISFCCWQKASSKSNTFLCQCFSEVCAQIQRYRMAIAARMWEIDLLVMTGDLCPLIFNRKSGIGGILARRSLLSLCRYEEKTFNLVLTRS